MWSKYKQFELMLILIQVVLSCIVFSKCCRLKREALCLQICFEMFAKILVVSLIKMFVSSIRKKANNFVVYYCKLKMLVLRSCDRMW